MDTPREIKWKALEYHHFEKTIEWFLVLFIITGSLTFSAFYLGNVLLGLLIVIATIAITIVAVRKPRNITYSVSVRGVRIGNKFYPSQTLSSYSIDEEHRHGPHLLAVTKNKLSPMLIIPIPEDLVDDVDSILGDRIEEKDLEEPFYNIVLEIFRF